MAPFRNTCMLIKLVMAQICTIAEVQKGQIFCTLFHYDLCIVIRLVNQLFSQKENFAFLKIIPKHAHNFNIPCYHNIDKMSWNIVTITYNHGESYSPFQMQSKSYADPLTLVFIDIFFFIHKKINSNFL